jgi:ABC-type transport system involved in multi-copper enzyme maturation permease subunit
MEALIFMLGKVFKNNQSLSLICGLFLFLLSLIAPSIIEYYLKRISIDYKLQYSTPEKSPEFVTNQNITSYYYIYTDKELILTILSEVEEKNVFPPSDLSEEEATINFKPIQELN